MVVGLVILARVAEPRGRAPGRRRGWAPSHTLWAVTRRSASTLAVLALAALVGVSGLSGLSGCQKVESVKDGSPALDQAGTTAKDDAGAPGKPENDRRLSRAYGRIEATGAEFIGVANSFQSLNGTSTVTRRVDMSGAVLFPSTYRVDTVDLVLPVLTDPRPAAEATQRREIGDEGHHYSARPDHTGWIDIEAMGDLMESQGADASLTADLNPFGILTGFRTPLDLFATLRRHKGDAAETTKGKGRNSGTYSYRVSASTLNSRFRTTLGIRRRDTVRVQAVLSAGEVQQFSVSAGTKSGKSFELRLFVLSTEDVEVTMPLPSEIDPTPAVDEEGLAALGIPVYRPSTLPGPGWFLVTARALNLTMTAEQCAQATVQYNDAAAKTALELYYLPLSCLKAAQPSKDTEVTKTQLPQGTAESWKDANGRTNVLLALPDVLVQAMSADLDTGVVLKVLESLQPAPDLAVPPPHK